MNITKDPGTNNTNITTIHSEWSFAIDVVPPVWYGIICVLGISGNGMVLIYNLLIRPKQGTKVLEICILNAATSDFFSSFVCLPLIGLTYVHQKWHLGGTACLIIVTNMYCWVSVSALSHVLIAAYCYVKCVLKPTIVFNKRRTIMYSALIWILASAYYVALIFTDGLIPIYDHVLRSCRLENNESFKGIWLRIAIGNIYLPLLLAVIIYIAIFIKMKIRRNTAINNHSYQKNRSSMKAMLGLMIMYVICFVPTLLIKLFDDAVPQYAVIYSHLLTYSTLALNPIYFTVRIKSIVPKSVQKLFSSKQVHPEVSGTVPFTIGSSINVPTAPKFNMATKNDE